MYSIHLQSLIIFSTSRSKLSKKITKQIFAYSNSQNAYLHGKMYLQTYQPTLMIFNINSTKICMPKMFFY